MSFPRSRLLLLLGAAVLLLHLVLPRPDLRPATDAFDRYLDGRSFDAHAAQAEPVFRDASTGESVPAAAGAIFTVIDNVRRHFRGTYVGGDGWTGHLYGEPFTVDAPVLYLPVAGYPASAGNGLFVVFSGPGKPEDVREVLRYEGANPREAVGMWEVDVRRFRGMQASVEMFDGLAAQAGWVGVGRPLLGERAGLGGRGPGDFGAAGTAGVFWWGALVVSALLWVPGLALFIGRTTSVSSPGFRADGVPLGETRDDTEVVRPTRGLSVTFADAAWLAVPGLLGLTGLGLLLWLTGLGQAFLLGKLYVAAMALAALGAARRTAGAGSGGGSSSGRLALTVYAGVVFVVLQFSVVPLTIERESFPGTNQRGRMVCSPPDNATPYATGAYLFHGHDGRERAGQYFGEGWTLTSRGPLVPLGVAALFHVFGLVPPDPPQSGEFAWPADEQGYYLARIFGVLTNALVVLAIAALAARAAAPAGRGWRAGIFALAWAALSPLVFMNAAYNWPKLLAATFALLAAERVLAGNAGAWKIGGLLALGYYAHPVGGLLAPGVIVLRATLGGTTSVSSTFSESASPPGQRTTQPSLRDSRRQRSSLRGLVPAAGVMAAFVACLLPWLAFKRSVGGPERFARYPLGDGRGYQDALGVGSWALARAKNVYYTLVPAAFHFSNETPEWFEAPLRGAARWNVAYGKGLPGHLGYGAFWIGYAAALGWGWRAAGLTAAGVRGLRRWTVWATFAGMVLVWGFNADGMGRNCLEGLSPFVLALGAGWAATKCTDRVGAVVLAVVAAETGWVMFSGFFMGNGGSRAVGLPVARWAQLGALGLTWVGLLALLLAAWRRPAPAPGVAVAGADRSYTTYGSPAVAPIEKFHWAVLLGVAFVGFTRRPDQWVRPQFWAEDAVVLFNHAWHEGFSSVFRPYLAYFALYQRGAAWAASLFPATWAPGFYAVASVAALLLAAAFILRARLPAVGARGKALLALALVAVPHGGEVFGTLINTQWVLAPTLWVLILQEPARTRREAAEDFAMLVLVGLTGPFVVIFGPWFLLRWRGGGWRQRYDFWLVAAAWTLAALQLGAILQRGPVEHAAASHAVGLWLKAVGFQLPGGLFFGASVPHYLGRAFFLITPALLGVAVWALARAERGRTVAALVVLSGGLIAYAGGMYEVGGQRPDMITPFGPAMRYFYPFYVAAAWAAVFLWHDRRSPAVRRVAGIALLAMLLAAASAWTAPTLVPFDWNRYARRMDAGEPVVIAPINPAGWTVEIKARPR